MHTHYRQCSHSAVFDHLPLPLRWLKLRHPPSGPLHSSTGFLKAHFIHWILLRALNGTSLWHGLINQFPVTFLILSIHVLLIMCGAMTSWDCQAPKQKARDWLDFIFSSLNRYKSSWMIIPLQALLHPSLHERQKKTEREPRFFYFQARLIT